jgi:hypothetical protein
MDDILIVANLANMKTGQTMYNAKQTTVKRILAKNRASKKCAPSTWSKSKS